MKKTENEINKNHLIKIRKIAVFLTAVFVFLGCKKETIEKDIQPMLDKQQAPFGSDTVDEKLKTVLLDERLADSLYYQNVYLKFIYKHFCLDSTRLSETVEM